jgi:hypothetical protein
LQYVGPSRTSEAHGHQPYSHGSAADFPGGIFQQAHHLFFASPVLLDALGRWRVRFLSRRHLTVNVLGFQIRIPAQVLPALLPRDERHAADVQAALEECNGARVT